MSQKIGFGVNKQIENVILRASKSMEDPWVLTHQFSAEKIKAAIAKIEAKKARIVSAGSAVNLDKFA